ncbi:uncharacterized protein MKK02DRAFT_30907 [Dioszegia hungarica]|uniref:Uncharacterized protein n=1 Tax=Dioszegia hungarica TaxID=4972 RepID=A0AA38LPF5_9TREE|nr:uncharacterized protein MKK02DRAFT_30907 [Dioszegia hungarica]KAI9631932.1 hypothetical protein MKK02DRAFT_30907 [Dioszegia hungarica]
MGSCMSANNHKESIPSSPPPYSADEKAPVAKKYPADHPHRYQPYMDENGQWQYPRSGRSAAAAGGTAGLGVGGALLAMGGMGGGGFAGGSYAGGGYSGGGGCDGGGGGGGGGGC